MSNGPISELVRIEEHPDARRVARYEVWIGAVRVRVFVFREIAEDFASKIRAELEKDYRVRAGELLAARVRKGPTRW